MPVIPGFNAGNKKEKDRASSVQTKKISKRLLFKYG